MTRKAFSLFLFLLVVLMLISPVAAQAPLDSYTSQDGHSTLSYPHGWSVHEDGGVIYLRTSESVPMDESRIFQAGEGRLTVQILGSIEGASFDSAYPGATMVEKLQESFVNTINAGGSSAGMLGDAAATTIGEHPAAFTTGKLAKTGNVVEVILEDFENGGYGLIILEAAPDGLQRFEPKIRAIAASIVYTPPPDSTFPLMLGALIPISTYNAWSVEQLATINAHQGRATTVAISPDNLTIASGGDDGDIHLWDSITGQPKNSPDTGDVGIQQLLYTSNGQYLVSAQNDGTVHLWDAITGKQKAVKQHDDGIWWMAISPNSQELAYISFTNIPQKNNTSSIWLWNLETNEDQMIVTLPENLFGNSIAFSPDSQQLFFSSSGKDQTNAWLYDVATQEEISHWAGGGSPIDVFFTADSRPIVSKTASIVSYDILLWNPVSDSTLFTLKGHQATVYQTVPNADRTMLGTPSFDGSVRLWDAQSGDLLAVLREGPEVLGMVFSQDSRLVVTSDADGKVYLWGVRPAS